MKLAHELIIKPIITEHSVDLMSQNKYTFKVDKGANKIEIKKQSKKYSRFVLLVLLPCVSKVRKNVWVVIKG